MGLVSTTNPNFVPKSEWQELEAAREAHERAVEEHLSANARRRAARQEERQLQEHLQSVQRAQQEARREADREVKHAVNEALRVVEDRGAEWLEEIATARAAALAERDELLAQAAVLDARSRENDAVEAWLLQVTSSSVPQAFGAVAEAVAS